MVSRERTRHFDAEAAVRVETASSHGVHLHKVLCDDAQEVRLYCFSEERAAKERGIVERFAKRFEDALTQALRRILANLALRNASTKSGSASVGSKLRAAASLSTTMSNSTPMKPDERVTAVRFTRRPLSRLDDDPSRCVLPAQQ